jgi:superfamily II helicase
MINYNFQDRGPILEVIVSRMRYIADHTANTIRIVGLSTALANARDLGDWLGIQGPGTSSLTRRKVEICTLSCQQSCLRHVTFS